MRGDAAAQAPNSSMRTLVWCLHEGKDAPGRIVFGATRNIAPRCVSSVYAASMLFTRTPKVIETPMWIERRLWEWPRRGRARERPSDH